MAVAPPALKRHYSHLSEAETQKVVEAVADLIVCFLKKRPYGGQSQTMEAADEHTVPAQEAKGTADEDHR